jgi:hypothetical protein
LPFATCSSLRVDGPGVPRVSDPRISDRRRALKSGHGEMAAFGRRKLTTGVRRNLGGAAAEA